MANILVYVETIDEQADPACLDVLASMRRIASRLGATLYAVMPTVEPPVYGEDDIVATISRHGADKVILLSHPALAAPASFDSHGAAVLAAAERLPPSLLVFADTPGCRDVAVGCSAALSAPLLVHPRIDIDHHPWPALVMSRFHDQAETILLGEMDRPVVVVAAPGRTPFPSKQSSDDAEVVVLSPKTTLRRMSAMPLEPISVPPRGSDLLLVGQHLDPEDRTNLFRLGLRLGADVLTIEDEGGASAPPPDEAAAAMPRSQAQWAKVTIFFGEGPRFRDIPDPAASSDLLWVSKNAGDGLFRPDAKVTKEPQIILKQLLDMVPETRQQTASTTSRPLHFRPATKGKSFDERNDDSSAEQPAEVVVLLAGPEPTEKGPRLEVLLDFLEPAVQAALSLPARQHVALCCGQQQTDRLLEKLGRRPFDRLIRVVPPLAGPVAPPGLARMLAAAVRKLGADLVVAADRGARRHRGIIGPAVARALDWPFLTKALGPFSLSKEGLVAHKQAWQTTWAWQIEMPAVLCVAQADVEQEQNKSGSSLPDIESWTMQEIDLQKEDVVPLCKPREKTHEHKRVIEDLTSAQDVLSWVTARRSKQ